MLGLGQLAGLAVWAHVERQIVALDVAASWTSFSVTPPTPRCTNDSLTSSRSSLRSDSVTASSEPFTSALTMRFSVAASPV